MKPPTSKRSKKSARKKAPAEMAAERTRPLCGKKTVYGLVDGLYGKVEITVRKETGQPECPDRPSILNGQEWRELNQQMFEIRLGW